MSKPSADRTPLGIFQVVVAIMLFSGHDLCSKYLVGLYPVIMVVWARYTVHTLMMLVVFAPRHGAALVKTSRPRLQVVRAFSLLGSSLFFTSGLHYIPLAEATAINFMAPLFVTALSAPLLKERVTLGQWLAVCTSFLGIIFIVRPGGAMFDPATLLVVAAALCFSGYQLLTRVLRETDSPTTSNFITGLVNTLSLSAMLPFVWQDLHLEHALIALCMGSCGMFGHLLLTHAFQHAPPAVLAPFSYGQIVFAGLIGYGMFGDMPDLYAYLGMALICGSGLMVVYLQRQRRAPVKLAGDAVTSG
jgi:drug/metabolite transporter (DMT)-like permease